MPREELIVMLVLPIAGLTAGVLVLIAALRYRARMLELVHKERVALIERGLTPSDLSAGGFDARRLQSMAGTRSRSFSLGIIVVGLGLALMTLIGVAAQAPSEAVGIGGAIAILGAAFIVRSLLVTPPAPDSPQTAPPPSLMDRPPQPPPDPPPADRL